MGSAEREDETDEIEKFNLFTHMSGKGFFCGALMKCVIKCIIETMEKILHSKHA